MTASFIDRIVEVLQPLFSNWGYLIVFAGALLESIFITGWIAPGTSVILMGSFYAAQGELNLLLVWCISICAGLIGDNVGYFMGRKVGQGVVEKYGDRKRIKRGMELSGRYFSRYGGVTVLFGRMVSGVDSFIPLTAGLNSMPYGKYMLYDVPGAMLWAGILAGLGYIFGNNWHTIDKIISALGWGLLGVIAAIAAVAYLVYRRRKGRQAAAPREDAQDVAPEENDRQEP